SSGSTSRATRAARGSLPRPKRLSSRKASLGERIGLLLPRRRRVARFAGGGALGGTAVPGRAAVVRAVGRAAVRAVAGRRGGGAGGGLRGVLRRGLDGGPRGGRGGGPGRGPGGRRGGDGHRTL